MKLVKLQKLIANLYGNNVQVVEDEYSRILTGTSDSWHDIVSCGRLAVDDTKARYVVNDIQLSGVVIPPMRVPNIVDKSLDGKHLDVLVIGGGISGTSILRELTKWDISTLLVDKESDIAMQATGRNDGQVHVGIDLKKSTTKYQYINRGNAMFDQLCHELDVPFVRCGQFVVIKSKSRLTKLLTRIFAWHRRHINKIKDTVLIGKKKLAELEPQLALQHDYALYNANAGTVCPYNLAIAYAENAVNNGAEVSLNTAVLSMEVVGGQILSVTTNRGVVYPTIVVNASGTFADVVADMAGDRFFSIHPRKGTNSILDAKASYLTNGVTAVKSLSKDTSHSKGGGIIHTVHDNILVGPDANETYLREDFSTEHSSIDKVFDKQRNTNANLSENDIITYFAGTRASTYEEDYIITMGKRTKNIVHCAGIQSPGITTAPAVAEDVANMVVKMLSANGAVDINHDFDPVRHGIPVIKDMDDHTRDKYIKSNPDYGIIVCRCEEISKGEILDALNSPICVPTIDGVKKRVRPGMGRCQGGFCTPLVAEIIAKHQKCQLQDVVKSNIGSNIAYGSTKEVH